MERDARPKVELYEAANTAIDLLTHAKICKNLSRDGVELALWQARSAIDVALEVLEREQQHGE